MQQVLKSFAKMDISYSDLRNKRACLLNIFYIFEDHFFVFKELFSENLVIMYLAFSFIKGCSFIRQVRVHIILENLPILSPAKGVKSSLLPFY